MMSRSLKHQMNGLTLILKHKMGVLPLKKYTTQADRVYYPTVLYFNLENKETNTRLIFSQLSAIQFFQMNMTITYVHMKGGFLSTKFVKGGKTRIW